MRFARPQVPQVPQVQQVLRVPKAPGAKTLVEILQVVDGQSVIDIIISADAVDSKGGRVREDIIAGLLFGCLGGWKTVSFLAV